MKTQIYYQQSSCPFGTVHIYANEHHLKAVLFKPWDKIATNDLINKSNDIVEQTRHQLQEYFQGKRQEFDLPLKADGTDFQQTVWQALCKIPFGETWNYGQLAQAIGNKNASRAVGAANGKNPISIIVPCHRVIGANGTLTGYAGGLTIKEWLLKHEGIIE
ncbi:methylated-DNA--[protein]-cysteine S-methyltransferase [Kangiella koreensis]|uniref:Methylated-DNA--protein-cysteine methyltransferase n=1 Tax=Kangiella koreensis (strain DSM 16069 / JCM 12317 / KCTC 12182 / SW-125) TaxID=523791 RepID=C7R5W8_KANKD|nr:methylated-DNA--[protein]-cysteine S-methyltransferase [Kangiella koreensis]ACV27292.1 methylated-DNA/protein-cysteinemethyltransferase [Kangiella koreensis DSM 16069]